MDRKQAVEFLLEIGERAERATTLEEITQVLHDLEPHAATIAGYAAGKAPWGKKGWLLLATAVFFLLGISISAGAGSVNVGGFFCTLAVMGAAVLIGIWVSESLSASRILIGAWRTSQKIYLRSVCLQNGLDQIHVDPTQEYERLAGKFSDFLRAKPPIRTVVEKMDDPGVGEEDDIGRVERRNTAYLALPASLMGDGPKGKIFNHAEIRNYAKKRNEAGISPKVEELFEGEYSNGETRFRYFYYDFYWIQEIESLVVVDPMELNQKQKIRKLTTGESGALKWKSKPIFGVVVAQRKARVDGIWKFFPRAKGRQVGRNVATLNHRYGIIVYLPGARNIFIKAKSPVSTEDALSSVPYQEKWTTGSPGADEKWDIWCRSKHDQDVGRVLRPSVIVELSRNPQDFYDLNLQISEKGETCFSSGTKLVKRDRKLNFVNDFSLFTRIVLGNLRQSGLEKMLDFVSVFMRHAPDRDTSQEEDAGSEEAVAAVCPQCGTMQDGTYAFCNKCGAATGISSFCRHCGAPGQSRHARCTQCGGAVEIGATYLSAAAASTPSEESKKGPDSPPEMPESFPDDHLDVFSSPELNELIRPAEMLRLEAHGLMEEKKFEEAAMRYDQAILSLGESPRQELSPWLLTTFSEKAQALLLAERYEEAVRVCDEILSRYEKTASTGSFDQFCLASSLATKSNALICLGRHDESIAACDETLRRFERCAEEDLLVYVCSAVDLKTRILRLEERPTDAITCHDKLIQRLADASDPELIKCAEKARILRAQELYLAGRIEEAMSAYEDVAARYSDSKEGEPEIMTLLPNVLPTSTQELVQRIGNESKPERLQQVATVMRLKAESLSRVGRFEEGFALADEIGLMFGDSPDPDLQICVAATLAGKVVDLGMAKRYEESIACCDKFVERYWDSKDLKLSVWQVHALKGKIASLSILGRDGDAELWKSVLMVRFATSEDPDIIHVVFPGLEHDTELRKTIALDASNWIESVSKKLVSPGDVVSFVKAPATASEGCGRCGSALESDDRFCTECGEKVNLVPFCRHCGAPLQASYRFCNQCGKAD